MPSTFSRFSSFLVKPPYDFIVHMVVWLFQCYVSCRFVLFHFLMYTQSKTTVGTCFFFTKHLPSIFTLNYFPLNLFVMISVLRSELIQELSILRTPCRILRATLSKQALSWGQHSIDMERLDRRSIPLKGPTLPLRSWIQRLPVS